MESYSPIGRKRRITSSAIGTKYALNSSRVSGLIIRAEIAVLFDRQEIGGKVQDPVFLIERSFLFSGTADEIVQPIVRLV